MSEPQLKDLEKVVEQLVLPFYAIEREMHIPFPRRRLESDAEHAWSVSLLACSLAPMIDKSLDIGLIAQFATVHDLVEVFAGDTSIWASAGDLGSKEEREAKALEEIKKRFSASFPWIAATIEKYERKDTNEALFLWALDKLIPMIIRHLDKGRAFREMKMTKEMFNARVGVTAAKAHAHPVVAKYWDELIAIFNSDPDFFYKG